MDKSCEFQVTLCISIYNSEKFLRKCLDSVVSQTLKRLEIILVNDGSTDSSLKIMNEYRDKYPNNIKVISQENKGLAQGRQTGIDHANGEFIAFLDSDDYVKKDAYEKMYDSAIKNNVDIVECMSNRDGKILKSDYKGVKNSNDILIDYFSNGDIMPMIWLRLYKRNLFVKPVMPNIHVNNEDVFAFPCLLYKAKNIFFLKEVLHFYSLDNEESVMAKLTTRNYDEKKIINNRVKTLYVINHIKNFIGTNNIKNKYSNEFKAFTARTVLNFCLHEFKSLSKREIMKIAFEKTDTNLKVLKTSFKTLKHYNKLIQKSINYFGLEKTMLIYKKSKRIFRFIK